MIKKTLCILTGALLFLFTSCENFMNGSDVQEQLTRMVDKANAKNCTIVVSNDTTMGSFLSSGDKSCQLGYTIEVQFNVKKDTYIYKGLKAVSKSDETKSLNDCVEFTEIDSDSSRGVYKTSIKLVKESDDILIMPDCVLIPAVLTDKCKPDNYPNAWEQDTVINIVFNKPVEITEFFIPTITDGSGENLSSYFGAPYLSANSQVLYIPVADGKQLLEENDKAETRDIIVTIDLSTIKDEEGNYGSGTFSHKYRVNKSKDNNKPEMKAVSVYSTSDKSKAYYKELKNTAYSDWTYNPTNFGNYNTNHVGSSVYVEFDAEDIGSGVSSFVVKETLIKTAQGAATGNITITSKPQPAAKSDETGRLCSSYTIGTSVDGIIKLEFFARDNTGNISNNSISFYVLKDTTIRNDSIIFKNNVSDLFVPIQDGSYLVSPKDRFDYITELNNSVVNNIQTVSLIIEENCCDVYYLDEAQAATATDINSVTAAYTPYNFDLYWSYTAESITTGPIVKQNGAYTFKRDVDQVVYVKIVATDSIGNTKEIIKTIAPRLKIVISTTRGFDFENSDLIPSMCAVGNSEAVIGSASVMPAYFVQYELTYKNDNNEVYDVKNYSKIVTEEYKIWNGIEDYTKHPEGVIKAYMIPNFGDITAPISSNYIQYTIDHWNEDPENGESQIGSTTSEGQEPPLFIFGQVTLSDAIPDAEAPIADYGPISESVTVKITPLQKTKLCKVEVSNYLRNGFNKADYIFKFYQFEIIPETEPPYKIKSVVVSSSPVIYSQPSEAPEQSLGFGIQIEAYSISEEKWYRPKPLFQSKQGLTLQNIENGFLCELYKLDADFKSPEFSLEQESNGTIGYNSQYMQGGLYIPSGISDSHNNLDKQSILSYYIIPNSDTKLSQGTRVFSLEDLEKYYSSYKKTMYYRPVFFGDDGDYMTTDEQTIGIPFGNTEDGYYTIVVAAADKMGNTAIHSKSALILSKGELPWKCERVTTFSPPDDSNISSVFNEWKFTLNTKNNPEVIVTETEDPGSGNIQGNPSIVTYIDFLKKYPQYFNNKWSSNNGSQTLLGSYLSQGNYEKHTSGNKTYYTISINQFAVNADDSDCGSWVRLRSYIQFPDFIQEDQPEPEWGDKGSYYIDYFYCGTNDKTCYTKICIEGINGIQVMSDRPVFAHTMYSDVPLTTSKNDDNAVRIWENKGVETGVMLLNKNINEDNSHSIYTVDNVNTENNPNADEWYLVANETYGSENFKPVPKGFWYTTIFHFADGSTAMTDIKQKQ